MSFSLKIGSRPSALALAQSQIVKRHLEQILPGIVVEIVPIKTSGDRLASASLAQIGGKGLFVRELEQALVDGRIDVAVHSMKDLPAVLQPDFRIAAVPMREDPRDALITRSGGSFENLRKGAKLGTSSSRRRFEALRVRQDLEVMPLRGNVDTRIRRLEAGDFDAIVIAMAGLKRLDQLRSTKPVQLNQSDFVPCGGQGALALEIKADRPAAGSAEIDGAIASMNDPASAAEVTAERAYLAAIGASCASPVGVKATANGVEVRVRALLFSLDGTRWLEESVENGQVTDAAQVGVELGERMIAAGARELING
jgi:hydroxymethylbilane synthase